jgi:BMFP domain-containing protein YqiC
MLVELTNGQERLQKEMASLRDDVMEPLNTKLDDILDKLSSNREDLDNTKGHLIYVMEDSLSLGKRITKLEEEMRRTRNGGREP